MEVLLIEQRKRIYKTRIAISINSLDINDGYANSLIIHFNRVGEIYTDAPGVVITYNNTKEYCAYRQM